MRRRGSRWAALAALILLTACGGGSSGPTVRIFDGSGVPSGGQGQASTVGGSSTTVVPDVPGGAHVVQRGETLYAISRKYGVPLRALIVENGLSPPYELLVGQRIRLPTARTHTVRAGETVYGISRQYGVAMNELVRANRIRPPYTIKVGQMLSIPASTESRTTRVSASATPAPQPAPSTSQTPSTAQPAPPAPEPAAPPAKPPAEPAPPPAPAEETAFGPQDVIYPPAKPREPPRLVGPIPRPPVMSGDGFLWPTQGRILSNYGPKGRGLHNDGINIAAPRGSAILAAENGVVAYAGDGLQGFGNIVLVKHQDGYVTAYAHADALLVSRGQIIRRGQAIARVGSTGTVDTPQVHFQIRRGREAIDPRRLLLTS